MKRLFITLSFVLTVLVLFAIPAKRGLWQALTLTDGSVVRAQLVGDEHMHFWLTEDGRRYTIQPDGKATKADMGKMRANAMKRRAANNMSKRLRSPRKVNIGDRTHYTGKKKGIVILMQFTDTKFKTANNQAKYNDILNKENYTTGSFKGSVADYFKAQSGGQFELTFDVLGPFPAKKNYAYYGKNDGAGYDMHPDELVVEAVTAADDEVDFRDYDWDGDGMVDQVFIVYAGKGEADGGSSNTIWPHMYWLNKTRMEITLDSVLVDTYACANELSAYDSSITGIGCFCHEFSHCLGYPDFYDIYYEGMFGMSEFDIMDTGSYNGNSFQPAGYTAYEKWMAGWIEPAVLGENNDTVTNLVPTSNNGGAYVMYNDAHPDEFYMIENRQKTNWDAGLPAKGLMITHVDFDKEIWEQNTPNSKVTQSDVAQSDGELTKANDHQRCTIFHADNDDDHSYWNSISYYYSKTTLTTDLYPYKENDSLTATSRPAATLFNKNSKGKKIMQGAILNITQNSDKTMNFIYRAKENTTETVTPTDTIGPVEPIDTIIPVKPVEARGDTLFYESFDKCAGTGGNDGKWTTTIATSSQKYITDNEGWEASKAYAGYQCARYGNGSIIGEATTPPFTINGEAVLTFRAAGWNKDGNQLKLSIRNYAVTQVPDSITTEILDSIGTELPDSVATLDISQFTMNSFAWKDYTVNITGNGIVRLTFTAELRFLLDEVLVISPSEEPPVILVGDVNGDGTVDVADIAAIIDVMAGTPNSSLLTPNSSADVNGDGTVDVADIAMVIDIMAGKSNEEP